MNTELRTRITQALCAYRTDLIDGAAEAEFFNDNEHAASCRAEAETVTALLRDVENDAS